MINITEALNNTKTTEDDLLELELLKRVNFTSTHKIQAFCWDDLMRCYMLVWDDIMIPMPV